MSYTPKYDAGDLSPIVIDSLAEFFIAFGTLAVVLVVAIVLVYFFKRK